ncbi:MAG TPA: cobalamin-dependent protein [Steroidobacteraceae bacterium]|nr:cobalamin-dependent protein [Steroidobacteraceae bacterium]
MSANIIRCMLGMLGTDIHSKGIRTLAQLLRDRGVEVIYLGEHNTPMGMVRAMLTEDVDIVGLSYSTATYLHYTRDLLAKMREAGLTDVPVMVGGLIHREDEPALREMGVRGIFGPGTTLEQIMKFMYEASGKAPAADVARP